MTFGRYPYGGVGYAGADVAEIPQADTQTSLAVEVAFTTGALEDPVWLDITGDVRSWSTQRGRRRELERHQPGRATVVLGNLSRQYDSVYTAGPHFGFIKPMRRMRIRETFNGVTYPTFDGFIDRWQLDYPDKGKDAIATVTATDGFKILARSALPKSVYEMEVEADSPLVWWKLNETIEGVEQERTAVNSGTGGTALDGTYVGLPKAGALGMIVNDDSTSVFGVSANEEANSELVGVMIDSSDLALLSTYSSWALELWMRPEQHDGTRRLWTSTTGTGMATQLLVDTFFAAGERFFQVTLQNETPAQLEVDSIGHEIGILYHVVVKRGPSGRLALWINGVEEADTATGLGTFASVDLLLGHHHNDPLHNLAGDFGQAAVYVAALGDDPLPGDRIVAHYLAGAAPWQDDLPGARIERILDLAEWPESLREIDTGLTTLQSVDLPKDALEHPQRVTETEFGLFFVDRTGKARFIDRTGVFGRDPAVEVYGDDVGVTDFVPDDGDQVIRNRALISRLGGAVKTAEDEASIEEFGPFDYTLEGLLHRTEGYSQDYANLIVNEYHEARRRITALTMGPPIVGEEDVVYPAMLGRELGDAIEVSNQPDFGGDPFTQTCVVEGIEHYGTPGGVRETKFTLSPEMLS